ncbi:MAG: type III pantothenate kinase [Planctomycetota bacterium]
MLLAVDVGNSRIKFGLFTTPGDCVKGAGAGGLPIAAATLRGPTESVAISVPSIAGGELSDWLERVGAAAPTVAIASVCPPSAEVVVGALNASPEPMMLTARDTPIEVHLDEPERVGIDRLVAAAAANRLRREATPAIVIDIGTAITVDLLSGDGAFQGGAILPGPTLAGNALAERTALLPEVHPGELDASPDAVGVDTETAMLAGLFWATVGALRELIARQRDRLTKAPQVFLTGGASPAFARLIGGADYTVRYVPDLTLSGVALAAEHARTRRATTRSRP